MFGNEKFFTRPKPNFSFSDLNELDKIRRIDGTSHRVWEYKGSRFVEILLKRDQQKFVADFLEKLGFLVSRIVVVKDDKGADVYLSEVIKPEDLKYVPNGKVIGWGQLFLLSFLLLDFDHYTDQGLTDIHSSDGPDSQNVQFAAGNFIFYDFDQSNITVSNGDKDVYWMIDDLLINMKNAFRDQNSKEVNLQGFEKFLNDVNIFCFSETQRLLKTLEKDGVRICVDLSGKLNCQKLIEVFKSRLRVAEEYFAKEISI